MYGAFYSPISIGPGRQKVMSIDGNTYAVRRAMENCQRTCRKAVQRVAGCRLRKGDGNCVGFEQWAHSRVDMQHVRKVTEQTIDCRRERREV